MSITRIKNSGINGAKYRNALAGIPGVMSAPNSLSIISGTSVSVGFDTQTGATSYTVISSPGNITATGSSSPITVTGLTANTAYTFQVAAINANGQGAYSSASTSITPVTQGFATEFNMNSTAQFYAMDYDATDNAMVAGGGFYTGTRREEGIAKIDVTTGTPSWVKGQYDGTNQGYTMGVGYQQSLGYVCSIGYMGGGNNPGFTVNRRSLSNGTINSTNQMQFSGGTASSTTPITGRALTMNGNTPYGVFNIGGYTPGRGGVMKFNTGMSENWAYTIGANETNYGFIPTSIRVDSSNQIYIPAYGLYTDYRAYVAKINASSTPTLTYMTRINADSVSREAKDATYDSSGNLYVVGRGNTGTKATWIAKFNTSGGLTWAKDITISNVDNLVPGCIELDSSGNIYIAGYFNQVSPGNTYERGFLIKFDSSGAILWQRYLYTPSNNYSNFYQIKINGNYIYLAGAMGALADGSPRPFALQYTTAGNPSSLVQTIGPMTNWTIEAGSFSVSSSALTVTSVSSPVWQSNTTSLTSQSLTDNNPTYTSNTIQF